MRGSLKICSRSGLIFCWLISEFFLSSVFSTPKKSYPNYPTVCIEKQKAFSIICFSFPKVTFCFRFLSGIKILPYYPGISFRVYLINQCLNHQALKNNKYIFKFEFQNLKIVTFLWVHCISYNSLLAVYKYTLKRKRKLAW